MKHWKLTGIALTAAMATATAAQGQELLRLSTLGAGSSPYLVMSTFANVVNDRLDGVDISINATGAATRHALDAARGEADFFMGSPTVHNFMQSGTAMYAQVGDAPELSEKVRALFSFPLGPYHIVTYADSGIEELSDLEGKRVFLGPPGGGALAIAIAFVEASTGLSVENDMELVQLGWDAAAQSFQDGQLDVYVNPSLAPSPVIQQIAFARNIRLLGFTEEQLEIEAMQGIMNRPGGTLEEIAADAYGGNQVNQEPVVTIGSNVSIAVGEHLSEELVYDIMAAFWDDIDAVHAAQPWMRQVQFDNVFRDLNMPLHPGAARYYEEAGLEIPDDLRPPQ
jgi:uncharacterized protein